MSKVGSFEPYGRGTTVFVVLQNITHFEEYSSNSDSGTIIYFNDGGEVTVGDHPSKVAKAIEEM